MKKTLFYFICFILIFYSTNTPAQCDGLCKILEDAKKNYATIKNENARLKNEIGVLKRENNKLKLDNQKLKIENEELRKEIAKLKNDQVAYKKSQDRLISLEEQDRKQKDTIKVQNNRINAMILDSVKKANDLILFKSRNIIFEDGFVIPCNIKLGPIPFSREKNYSLTPSSDQLDLLNHMPKINTAQQVVVYVRAPNGRKKDVLTSIKEQLEKYCPNCYFELEFESKGVWEISLSLSLRQ